MLDSAKLEVLRNTPRGGDSTETYGLDHNTMESERRNKQWQ
jgi:hypothetical protein